ncbi:winged helix-turn-helix domain-containing protein [Dinoroseobacter sp. S76]|uniref:winged helix-turn-helix domain-containing protein n=1 Tax=Dinoroseobacter sp. S76 TaxID=3415124 RepID=UPI003C7AEFC8
MLPCLLLCLILTLGALPGSATERAELDAALSARAQDLIEALDQSAGNLRFRLAADPALIGLAIWRGGTRLFPEPGGLHHVSDDQILRVLPGLEALRDRAAPTAWAEDGLSPDAMAWCHNLWEICLLFEASALAAEFGFASPEALRAAVFEAPPSNSRPWGLALGLVLAGVTGAFALRHMRSTAPASEPPDAAGFSLGDVTVDPRRMVASRGEVTADLTARDLRLLQHLAENPGAVLSKDELYDVGWGRDYMPNSRALDQHIATLRRKLDPDRSRAPVIETVHGQGYRLPG